MNSSKEYSFRPVDECEEVKLPRQNSITSVDSWEAVLDLKPNVNIVEKRVGLKEIPPKMVQQSAATRAFNRTAANRPNVTTKPVASGASSYAATKYYPKGEYSSELPNYTAKAISPLVPLQTSKTLLQRRFSPDTDRNQMTVNLPNNVGESTSGRNESADQTEKVKSKLMSVWNNMKYGWTVPTKTKFSFLSPIFLLGQRYQDTTPGFKLSNSGRRDSPMEQFKLDFATRIWLTYRRDFPPLGADNFTTDCGWGCMVRSGQMMLAQALVCHFLGRNWRCSGVPQTEKSEMLHRNIIRWFVDDMSDMCPLSLHHLVKIGCASGKKAGDWYGPASVSYMIKRAVESASQTSPLLDEIAVYVAQDCTVYKEDVEKLCTSPSNVKKIETATPIPLHIMRPQKSVEEAISWSDAVVLDEETSKRRRSQHKENLALSPLSRTRSNPAMMNSNFDSSSFSTFGCHSFPISDSGDDGNSTSDRWRGVVILVPVRLGGEKINPIYIPCLKRLLAHESSIGIIGGKPRHALYFVGYQEDKLIHLDPHFCQEAVDIRPELVLDTYHCTVPKKIPLAKMDPSCTIGFYLRTRDDFEKFVGNIGPLLLPVEKHLDYPIFEINPGSSSSMAEGLTDISRISAGSSDAENILTENDNDDCDIENFVML